MRTRYVVTVDDITPPNLFMKQVRRREFRNLAAARRYEGRMCRKTMKRGGIRIEVSNWGSVTHQSAFYDPIRLVTIICRTR